MIQMVMGLFMRGHRIDPLEGNANREAPRRPRGWLWWVRLAGWVLVSLLLAFAFCGAVVLFTPLPDLG